MAEDLIQILVDRAHQIFNETSIFEVIDLDKEAAREKLSLLYYMPDEKYLGIVERLRVVSE